MNIIEHNNPETAGALSTHVISPDALAALRQKAAMQACETWKPAPGETLEGVIVGSRKIDGPFGQQDQMLVQKLDGTTIAVWLTTWLFGQMRAQAAEFGDLVSIQFIGKEFGSRGQPFNRMTAAVLKAAALPPAEAA